jgi:hypothetical protein
MSAMLSSLRISGGSDRDGPASRQASFLADQRGAVAFEMPFVYGFMILSLLLPLADVAIAGFQYISAWQALRAFGQSVQYSPPTDVSNATGWATAAVANADPTYPIQNLRIMCGDGNAVCSAGNTLLPQYYSYATTVTMAPIVLGSILCPNGNCTYTLHYSERFQ